MPDELEGNTTRLLTEDSHDCIIRKSAFEQTPTEILSYILSLCPNSAEEVFSVSTYQPSNDRTTIRPFMSLHISHVCKRWRSIAHSLPSLWTVIPVVLNNMLLGALSDADVMRLVSAFDHYLILSQELPLDVVLTSPMKTPPGITLRNRKAWLSDSDVLAAMVKDMERILEMTESLMLHCDRWTSFHACLSGPQYALWNFHENLPLLRILILHACPKNPLYYTIGELARIRSSIFQEAPLLQRVEFSGLEMLEDVDYYWDEPLFPETFRGSMTYSRTNLPQAAELLASIPSRAALNLYKTDCVLFEDEGPCVEPCTFSGHSLTIVEPDYSSDYGGTPMGSLSNLFEELTLAPTVRELEFVCDTRSAYAFSVVGFLSCLSRSPSSTITHFTLRKFLLTTEHLLKLLVQLPLLTHLAVEEYGAQAYKTNHLSKRKPMLLSASLFESLEVKTDDGAPPGKKPKTSKSTSMRRRVIHSIDILQGHGFGYDSDECYYSEDEAYDGWEAEQLGPAVLGDSIGLLMPRLTHFALGFQRSALPEQEMVQMIKSRRGPSMANGVSVVGLQRFCLRYGLDEKDKAILRDETRSKLLALEGEGLEIDIRKGVEKMETYW